MAQQRPFMWQPGKVVEITNLSDENLLLELASGPQRLDRGRTLRMTASALEQPQVKALLDGGQIKAEPVRKR